MPLEPSHHCRVCGLDQGYPPWGEDGRSPDFTICSCCGTEFGYEDVSQASVSAMRLRWLDAGGKWFRPMDQPENWDVTAQLKLVPPAHPDSE
ncbi:MAG: hypothetical protein GC160_05125 [Acidobacteria bacterium]|nr:hypothetical protein [Acidobacteriota bacterium]